MNVRTILCAVALAVLPTIGLAQSHLPNLKDKLKVHKNRLPRPSHRLYTVHPRRLAVPQKGGGRRQVRIVSAKQHHQYRKSVRSVTHHLTAPHHPKTKHVPVHHGAKKPGHHG